LGQSGEGKTTLLRALAGLLPAEGEPFGGFGCRSIVPVGYLPQGYASVSSSARLGECGRLR